MLTVPALATALATTAAISAAPAVASVPVNGPYLLSSPIESNCGTQAGQVLGSFTATTPAANPDGSYDIQIKLTGTFETLAGPSVNACNSAGVNSGRTVREGVSGSYVSTSNVHLTSAAYTGTTTCPRDQYGSCDFFAYLHSAYGASVVFTQKYVRATLQSAAPGLIQRKAVDTCSGAACTTGHLKATGDIASGGGG
jgi:hypothetical protein